MAIFSVLALLLLTVCGANAETTQLITFATTTAGATTTGATAAPGGGAGVTTPGGAVVTTPKVVVSTYAPVTTGNTDIPSSYTTGVNLITTKKTNPVTTAAVQTTPKPKYTTTGDQLGEVTQPTTTTVDDQLGEVTTKKTTTFDDQLPPVVSTTTTPFDDQLGDVSTPPPSFLDFLTLYYNPFAGHCDAYKNSYIQFYACAEAWEDADHLFCRCPCANELAQDSRDNVTAIPCVETCVNGLLSNLGLTSDSLTGSKITVAVSDTCAQMRKRIKFFGSSSSEVGTSGDNGISVATIGVIAACVVLVAVVAGTIIYKRSTRTGSAQIGDENSPAPKQMNRKISRVSVRPLLEV